MNGLKEKFLRCSWCGDRFGEDTDTDDYKCIEDVGECCGCFETE